jgi:DNA-binding protein H-NS
MANQEVVVPDIEEEQSQDGGSDGKRERSTVEFPYLDLDAAIEIAKGVHDVGGSSCGWDQLAAHLKQAATGGGFRLRVMTAKTFGLVTYGQGTVTLTDLGKRLNDPQQEKAAKADAFLRVELYGKIYEQFKNGILPPPDALETEIVKMGVSPKQKGKARQAFQRSANSAGYFWSGSNRLVRPAIKASAAAAPVAEPETDTSEKKKKREDDEDEERRHPLIEGLLKELPKPQSEWTTEDRKKWLEMASTIFNVIYKDFDDSRGSLKVVVEKNSAKS